MPTDAQTKYEVLDTAAVVRLCSVEIGPTFVLTSNETGVIAYGLKDKLELLAELLNGDV